MNITKRLLLGLAAALSIAASLSCASLAGRDDRIRQAFDRHETNVPVDGDGIVTRVLPDDNAGARHQRFIIRTDSGQTVLIDHNIDIAPRIDGIKTGDNISFAGEYVWNDQGGLIHWTHHDPLGKHSAGYLRHNGRTYQ